MKRFWTYIKHKRSDGSSILKSAGILHDDSTDKANILNAQFQEAFSSNNDLSNTEFKERCNLSGQYPTAPDIAITQEGIKKLLNGLNPHKAAGPDNISSMILKELANEIAPILQLVFQRSYDTGVVPSLWKTANFCINIAVSEICPRRNVDTEIYNAILHRVSTEHKLKIIKQTDAFVSRGDLVSSYYHRDGIHLTNQGTILLLRNINKVVNIFNQTTISQSSNESNEQHGKDKPLQRHSMVSALIVKLLWSSL
ncbi:unnamed protein product [Mytilus edulis]|uniref:Uncharacterized protein n=1 Tax=Mytilus edulis TaxID=6550 RepID=A0A8S3QL08_MYTED|nr:unnamed protein product [Mytilus edulis]